MRAVLQRVASAEVSVEGKTVGRIGPGLLVFLGIADGDTDGDTAWLAGKIAAARVFPDLRGRMNLSVCDIEGEVMLISQFTLFGNLRKGTRPSFNRAADPNEAVPLYESCARHIEAGIGRAVATGVFGAPMEIDAIQDGPVTLIVDTRDKRF